MQHRLKRRLSRLLEKVATFAFLAALTVLTSAPSAASAQANRERIGPDNIDRLETLAVLGKGNLTAVAWSPDGNFVATSSSLGVWIYDTRRFSQEPVLLQGQPGAYFFDVTFSPDGKLLAASDSLSTTHVWSMETLHAGMAEEATLIAPNSWSFGSVAFSPDGTLLAHDNQHGQGSRIYFWNTKTRQELPYFQGTDARDITFSPDGKLLAEADFGGYAQIWDVQSGKRIAQMGVTGIVVLRVAFNPDGKLLATADDSTVKLWDVAEIIRRGDVESAFTQADGTVDRAILPGSPALAFSPNGKLLATTGEDGGIRVWTVADALKHKDLERDANAPPYPRRIGSTTIYIKGVAFSPDGTRLVTIDSSNVVRLWSVTGGDELARQSGGHSGSVISVTFNPSATLLASGGTDGFVRFWEVAMHRQRAALNAAFPVSSLAFSPNGEYLAAAGTDVELWSVAGQSRLWRSKRDKAPRATSLAFSPDGQTLFVADGTLTAWNVRTGKSSVVLQDDGCFSLVSWQTMLACESQEQGGIQLWDLSVSPITVKGTLHSPDKLSTLRSRGAFTFLQNGTLVGVFASSQNQLQWCVARWNSGTLALIGQVMATDKQALWDGQWMVINPEGSLFISSAAVPNFPVMYVHAMQTGNLVHTLSGHTDPVNGMVFSADGTLFASASDDNTVRLWDVRTP